MRVLVSAMFGSWPAVRTLRAELRPVPDMTKGTESWIRPPSTPDARGGWTSLTPEAREPVPLAGIVALDRLGLVFADIVPARRQGGIVGGVVIAAEQPHAPAL